MAVAHVHFPHLRLPRFGICNFIDHRAKHPAWAAPWRPEVQKHRHIGLKNFSVKIRFGNCEYVAASHRFVRVNEVG